MDIIILIGLQASGKSTFFRTHFAATHTYISKDLLRNNKARRQRQLLEEALQAGQSVVIDNTNPTQKEREELIQLGHLYGATICGYYFEVRVAQSLERNRMRTGKARVPDIAIFATLKRLAHPTYAEGFDQLFYVRSLGDQTFAISDWSDSTS